MKRVLTVIVVCLLVTAMFPPGMNSVKASSIDESAFNTALQTFKSTVYDHGSTYQDNDSGSLGYQCFGYANYLARYIFGSYPTTDMSAVNKRAGWTITYGSSAVDSLHIGDIVRYRFHSIFITDISGDTIYYTDANSDYNNTVHWEKSKTRSELKSLVAQNLTSGVGIDGNQYTGWVAHYDGWDESCSCSVSYAGNYICTTSSLDLTIRSGHGSSYSSIGSIPSGATVYVSKANGTWAHVEYNGISGFASMEYLQQQHAHSYQRGYEAAHPHRIYMKCSCEEYYYTGETTTMEGCSDCQERVTKLHVWLSDTEYGDCPSSFTVKNKYWLCYELYDANSGDLYNAYSDTDYSVTLTFYDPNGNVAFTDTCSNSDKNRIAHTIQYTGTYTCEVTLSGGLSGTSKVSFTSYSNGGVTFSKSSLSLSVSNDIQDSFSVTLSGNWPSDASVEAVYDESIISYSLSGTTFTITALKRGSTDFTLNVKDGNGSILAGATCKITVTAQTYSVAYVANGGTGVPETQKKYYGEDLQLSSTEPTRTGYTFLGWSLDPDSQVPNYISGSTYAGNESIVLYAVWKDVFYGDVNHDGIIDNSDILVLNKITRGIIEATDWQNITGDLNADGVIDDEDMTVLNNFRVGISYEFPVESMDVTLMFNSIPKKRTYYIGDEVDVSDYDLLLYYPETFVAYPVTSYYDVYLPSTSSTGTKYVTVLFEKWSASYSVEVLCPEITMSAVKSTIPKKYTFTISTTTTPGNQEISWKSSDTSVAEVVDGTVTAKAVGSATITASFIYNGIVYSESCEFTVQNVLEYYGCGDVNEDGKINTADVRFILTQLIEMNTFTKTQSNQGDVNADGVVDTADARFILMNLP